MKKAITLLLIALTLAVGGALLYFKGKRYEILITKDQIDASLSERLPVTKRYLLVFSITYSNPQVTFLDDENRVQVGLEATLNIRLDGDSRNLGGTAVVTSGIRYDSDTQEFFLDDAEFNKLEIVGIPDQWLRQVTDFSSKVAREFLETRPVYRLQAKDSKTAAAKLLLKDFEVRQQAIHVTLGI
jgi:hypothetical protein